MIEYSIDVLAALGSRGFTTYKLRKDKILGESTIQQLRNGELVSWASIDKICAMLGCQPGDILCHDGSPRSSVMNDGTPQAIAEYLSSKKAGKGNNNE